MMFFLREMAIIYSPGFSRIPCISDQMTPRAFREGSEGCFIRPRDNLLLNEV
jgi:hypothetical protein